jgi:pentose-5-phosphate-3-epimerase
MAGAAPKMAAAAALLGAHGRHGSVHVDGGINRETADLAGAWGADVCVVGSALFQRGRDTADEVRIVRDRAARGRAAGPPEHDLIETGTWRAPASAAERA